MRGSPLLALVLLLAPAAGLAQPLSIGDVSVGADGGVRVAGATVGKLPLPEPPRNMHLKRVQAGGRRLIHVRVTGKEGRAGELVMTAPPASRVVFSGATGPQGVDGEWSRHLRVDRKGVLLFQRHAAARRCDGAPVFLFPRLYDFAANRFRPAAGAVSSAGLPRLVATRRPALRPPGEPLNTFRLAFASTGRGDEGRASLLAAPSEAEDGDPATSWSEELGGDGRGELLIARGLRSAYGVRALRIIPGDAASRRAFARANRLRSALLVLSRGQRYEVVWERDPLRDRGRFSEPYWIVLPRPVATRCVALVLNRVYPGTLARRGKSGGRTAIAELRVFTELEYGGGQQQLLSDLKAGNPQQALAAETVLARLGERGVRAIVPLVSGAGPELLPRLARALLRNSHPAAVAPLAAMLPLLDPGHRQLAAEALAGRGALAVPELEKLLDGQDRELYEEVARLLGRIGGDAARTSLLTRAGRGGETLRAALVAGLVLLSRPEDLRAVVEAAQGASSGSRKADLVLAAGRMGRRSPRAGQVAEALGSLWDSARGFEVRYRLLAAIGQLDAAGQLRRLGQGLADRDPVLRWTAAMELGRARSVEAAQMLVRALADPDPRVRASAADGLGRRTDALDAPREALATLLLEERWALVASSAAQALGAYCGKRGVSALREAVRRGPRGLAVDSRALDSLLRCRPRGLGTFLLAMARDDAWRTGLRERALSRMPPKMARRLAPQLVELFHKLRREAARSESSEKVAVTAARTLGSIPTREAALALADALALDPFPSIRLAAVLALGQACHRAALPTLRRAAAGDSSAKVQRAARRAARRCDPK
jgi:HEAT repeat protein